MSKRQLSPNEDTMIILQNLCSLQVIKKSKKYFSRVKMDEFIQITGLAKIAHQALRLSQIIQAGKELIFGKTRGRPFIYTNVCIVITAILQSAWNLSDENIIQRFYDNPEFAVSAGYPIINGELNIIHPAHYGRRKNQLGTFAFSVCFILVVKHLIKQGIISLKDIIIDATTVWFADARDTEAKYCKYKKVMGYKLHLIIDRISMLPVMFGVTSANRNDCIVAVPLFKMILACFGVSPLIVRADTGYDTKVIRDFINNIWQAVAVIPKNFRKQGSRLKLMKYMDAQNFRIINAPRATIERVFGLLKQHRKLEDHHLLGLEKVTRHCCLKLISMLLTALVASKVNKPELALSPNKLLAHT